VLHLEEDSGVFAGEAIVRRLTRLAAALDLEAATETGIRAEGRKAVA